VSWTTDAALITAGPEVNPQLLISNFSILIRCFAALSDSVPHGNLAPDDGQVIFAETKFHRARDMAVTGEFIASMW